ncbi:MAG: hypothetical protein P0Y50_15395 [Candidatus Brevundimonas colombiensis]|jgi:hypothetical protein|uniref:Lipoprotein n=1 Tax=Candidatus Brevundimonas colombiensis TaxID=3121376 RepID=A0AAJ5X2K6_9CAUL|nr:hypothetical protein [Brevundimonas sp.]WEK39898.1 MAG: hypothetical protein P0Y50_15395 [Brevundimonas sp.]
MRFALIAIVAGAAALGACSNKPEYEFAPGACYFVATPDNAPPRLQKIADDQPQLEQCAARLEEMRLRFLRMGGSNQEIAGAYQGRFIFIDREGVKIGKSLTGSRFFSMARTGDGRLAIPGAIQRDETGRPVAVAADSAAK